MEKDHSLRDLLGGAAVAGIGVAALVTDYYCVNIALDTARQLDSPLTSVLALGTAVTALSMTNVLTAYCLMQGAAQVCGYKLSGQREK